MSSTSPSLKIPGAVTAVLAACALLAPMHLSAQSEMPSAAEVREALETLRRFERALAAEVPVSRSADGGRQARFGNLDRALRSPSIGVSPSPQAVDAPSSFALDIDGDFEIGGYIFKEGVPFVHNVGGSHYKNTAVGLYALAAGTPLGYDGLWNTAIGHSALRSTTTGRANTALGYSALVSNDDGDYNTAVGHSALTGNTSGAGNVAVGSYAFHGSAGSSNTVIGTFTMNEVGGSRNTVVGAAALGILLPPNNDMSDNIAIGYKAGAGSADGTDNSIFIANEGTGDETTPTTRIGTQGTQTRTFISGIVGTTTDINDAIPVLIDSAGQLGTVSSSARVKEDIHDLNEASDRLLDLRPVSFRYRKPFKDGDKPIQYGLIAEEVAEVLPELVVYNADGEPETVKYHLLSVLLLEALQDQRDRVTDQRHELEALRRRVEAVERGQPTIASRRSGAASWLRSTPRAKDR